MKKYLDNPDPNNVNELQADDDLNVRFATKAYGAALLNHLINVFNEVVLKIVVPESVKASSNKYIRNNITFK